MKRELHFPDWYSVNWDAFRDVLIAVVEIPDCVVLQHWQYFAQACPEAVQILREIMAAYPRERPGQQLLLAS